MTSGWVLRKVKQNDKWVRRWLEVNRHVLYSYQACPAESPQARVINMLDLRKISEIKLVDDGVAGLFSIVPVSADDQHPGYLMRADTAAKAQEWVNDLNKVRDQELAAAKAEPAVCDQPKAIDDQLKLNDELLAELAVCKEQLKKKEELMAAMEREVEQVVGEERARFDKERSRLEKELRKVLLRRLRFLTAAPSTRRARPRTRHAIDAGLLDGATIATRAPPAGEEGLQSFWATTSCIARPSQGRQDGDPSSQAGRETHPEGTAPISQADLSLINETVRQYGPRGAGGETEIS